MSSRDFGFITLRNTTAYQPNGLPVPPNYIFVTSTNGSAVFSNNISLSSLNASTMNASTINVKKMNASTILVSTLGANIINTNTLNASTINSRNLNVSSANISSLIAKNINVNFLTVQSTINASTINSKNINVSTLTGNIVSANVINGSTINANELNTSTANISSFFSENINTNFITVNSTMNASTISTTNMFGEFGSFYDVESENIIVSLLQASTISSTNIDTTNITTNYISTLNHMVLLDNNNSTLIMDSIASTLYINGFPVLTEGNISSISSLYWEDSGNGNIYNKNIGNAPYYYQVGIGTGLNPLNATLDVVYSGSGIISGNAFNISSYNNTFTINNTFDGSNNFMTGIFKNNQDDDYAISLQFIKSKNFNSTVDGSELGYISFYGTDTSQLEARGAYIVAKQNGDVGTYTPTDLQFITNTSSIDGQTRLIIKSDGNVGINTPTPLYTLDVNGSTNITGSLFVGGDTTFNGKICASTLCASTLEMTDGQIIGLSSIYASNAIDIIGLADDDASLKLFNGKTFITTNAAYNGCYIELDDSGPNFYITDIGDTKVYAQFGSTLNKLNANTQIIASSFYFSSLNATNADTFKIDLGGANLMISNSTFSYPSTTYIQNNGGGQLVLGTYAPSLFINGLNSGIGDYIGINTPTPQQRLDVVGNIRTTGNIYMNQGFISSAGSISTNYLTANSSVYTNYGIVNNNQGIRIIDGFDNSATRPPLIATSTISSYIIHGTSVDGVTFDDGFLQLSAGGGTDPTVISYIQLSGFSTDVDMDQNIVLGTSGVERMRLDTSGLNLYGNLTVNGSAVSRVACSTILTDPGSDGNNWINYYGFYNFISSGLLSTITLPTTNTPDLGTILVLRNTGATNPITVSNTMDTTGNIILTGKTSSYTYVSSVTNVPSGWYGL